MSGPLVVASGMREANMFDVVRVSEQRLIGEIIEMRGDRASIQVYEETSGLRTGEAVVSTGEPLSVELGPGLIGGIFDGIQRPLEEIMKIAGNNLTRGIEVPALSREKQWKFTPCVKVGDAVTGGDVLGTVQETDVVLHKIMLPPTMKGVVREISKLHNTTHNGTLSELVDHFTANAPRGEIVIVVAGHEPEAIVKVDKYAAFKGKQAKVKQIL